MPWRIRELRHNFYKQHALGYELLGLQGVLEPHAKLLLPIKHKTLNFKRKLLNLERRTLNFKRKLTNCKVERLLNLTMCKEK